MSCRRSTSLHFTYRRAWFSRSHLTNTVVWDNNSFQIAGRAYEWGALWSMTWLIPHIVSCVKAMTTREQQVRRAVSPCCTSFRRATRKQQHQAGKERKKQRIKYFKKCIYKIKYPGTCAVRPNLPKWNGFPRDVPAASLAKRGLVSCRDDCKQSVETRGGGGVGGAEGWRVAEEHISWLQRCCEICPRGTWATLKPWIASKTPHGV